MNDEVRKAQIATLRQASWDCQQNYGFNGELAVVSLILSTLAAGILLCSRKHRHFPHSFPLAICIGLAIQNLGRVISFSDTLRTSYFLCAFTGTLKNTAFVVTNYIWSASVIVLYQAVVLQRPIYKIRSQRRWYYAVLGTIALVSIIIPLALKSFHFVEIPHQCFIENSVKSFALFSSHGLISTTVFLILSPAIFRKLLSRRNAQYLQQDRVLMLRNEALRQMLIGLCMFVGALVTGYRGLHFVLLQEWYDAPASPVLQSLAYTSCAIAAVWLGIYGACIAVVYLLCREYWQGAVLKFKSGESNSVLYCRNNSRYSNHFSELVSPRRPVVASELSSEVIVAKAVSRGETSRNMIPLDSVYYTVASELEVDGIHKSANSETNSSFDPVSEIVSEIITSTPSETLLNTDIELYDRKSITVRLKQVKVDLYRKLSNELRETTDL